MEQTTPESMAAEAMETPTVSAEEATPAEETQVNEEITVSVSSDNTIQLSMAVAPVINYALHRNGVRMVQSVTITNTSENDLSHLKLSFESVPAFATPLTVDINFIPAGKSYEITTVDLHLDADFLAGMTERLEGELRATLSAQEVLATVTKPISILAFDQWSGQPNHPELLTAFVTPNHPILATVISRAATYLHKWTGDSAFTGYLYQDPDRVLKQAAALFCALKEENLIYCICPASFEETGQRIRLCDMVLQQKMGTCMDLTLLYASCLEAVGLHPLLIMTTGHIFTGVWLDELTFADAVIDDPAMITKRLAEGVNEIAVMETTLVVNGKNASFDDATAAAERHFLGKDPIECIIDVKRARLCGVTPIPQRVHGADGWHIEHDLPKETGGLYAPRAMGDTIDVSPDAFDPQAVPKMVQWERKLLDLGLRNNLISLRFSKNIVPLLTTSLDDLEDALSEGKDFSVLPRPTDWKGVAKFDFETMHDPGEFAGLVSSEYKNGRLRSIHSEGELTKTMKTLYRNVKTALEENGANTLYLVLGLLRWYENAHSSKARYAPVVLLPVELVRRGGSKGYVVRLRDDEPQINVTILEKMKQDFGINVAGLDPLPMDDHGVDLRRVFTILRKAMMGQDRWDILESAYLGIFSFSQFVMWNDMRNRSEDLLKNKIVRSLIDGKLAWEAKPMQIGDQVSEEGTLLPMPADASQLFAIKAACSGESFVLHGPPGTGKSQTITSLIANALAQGKSVLFVAEKKAALEVVQKRLEGIGIAPFCLELHSNKTKKRAVLEQLRIASEVTRDQTPEQYAEKAERLRELRENLDHYAVQLHTVLPCGYSVYGLINEYEDHADAPDLVVFDANFAGNTDRHMFDSHILVLERLVAAGKALGHPHNHPLCAVGVQQYTQQLRQALAPTVTAYRDAAQTFIPHAARLSEMLSFGAVTDIASMEKLLSLATSIAACGKLPKGWIKAEKPTEYFSAVQKMATHFMEYLKRREYLLKSWTEAFLEQDGTALLQECVDLSAQWLVPKMIGQRKQQKRLAEFAIDAVPDIVESVKVLYRMQEEKAAAEALLQTYGDDLGTWYQGLDTDWASIKEQAEAARCHIIAVQEYTDNYVARTTLCADNTAVIAACAMVENYESFRQSRATCYELLCLKEQENADWLSGQIELCDTILANADDLKDWITFVGIAGEAKDIGLAALVEAYCNGAAHEVILPAYRKAAYKALIVTAIDEQGILNAFSGPVFNEKIEQYKRIDKEFTDLVRQELFCRLAANVPDFTGEAAQTSELGILQRNIKSGGRGMSIRRLFEQLPHLLPRLCPCMLMSPISAAQYLDPKRKPFDIVVFDEASQLPTCKAVGVLARGVDAVIVGDPKQMPPTTFFATNAVDEENLDTEDLESILDDCLAINMPQTHLLWHYRSRHESLISFSNHQFYENKLFTFPSVNDRESKVSLVHVDGVFERGKGRRNRAEAEAVVAEICRRCHDPELSKLSVGVITFNISQQVLIDDLLNDACVNDPVLEKWMYESEEPLFIKNLENVQGDERDVILFSVGYGPDESGKVYMNFGPLNRDGGWRRLNVAVSRARSEMIVFSTLTPDQIDLSKTDAAGVVALKAFLAYAGGEEMALNESSSSQLQSVKAGIAKRIRTLLKAEGFDTDLNVGRSEYKIDVGVIDPEHPDTYILGILLDGSSYGAAKTTRDRELAQINILRDLGWNVMRIWTMDWWDNRHKEIKRIVAEVHRLQEEAKRKAEEETAQPQEEVAEEAAEDTTETAVSTDEVVREVTEDPLTPTGETAVEEAAPAEQPTAPATPACIQPYTVAVLNNAPLSAEELLSGVHDYTLLRSLETVLDAEAPIYRTVLFKRVLDSFGITRSGVRLFGYLENLLENLYPFVTMDGEEAVYWNKSQDPNAYHIIRVNEKEGVRRDPAEIPYIEMVNAMCYVLFTQIGIPHDGLVREAAKLLGFSHVIGSIAILAEEGFAKLTDMGLVAVDERERCALTEKGTAYAKQFAL